jgi:biopolymer transport protein ExbB
VEAPQEDLNRSLEELSALREQITAEKLPLANRLGDLETRLAQLRRQNDETLRRIDTGSFDLSKLDQEKKLRQDEMAYVGNILDEYARSLETRLAVGEAPRYRPVLDRAKEAPSNADLTLREKLDRQVEVLRSSIIRIEQLAGGEVIPGQAVEPKGTLADGQFAVIGPVALFASGDGATAGVAYAQAGSTQPAVRPLEDKALNAGVAETVRTGEGRIPVDPTRGGALKELVQKTNLIHIFKKGGPIMWPLLIVSILAMGAAIERILFLANEQRKRDSKALARFLGAAQDGDVDGAIRIGNASKYFVVRTLAYALEHRERSLASALLYANAQEIKRFSRGIAILDTSITIAPLLGLLGTVTGMMHSFSLIGGELSAPGAITGGIAEALIATAFGLGIAIISLLPYNYLNNKVEQARHELETAGHQLELMLRSATESSGSGAMPVAVAAGGRA